MKKILSEKMKPSIAATLLIAAAVVALVCFRLAGESVTVEAATVLYSGTSGDLDWSITSDGVLTINGTGDYDDLSWTSYSDEITSAVVDVDGITSTVQMFSGCGNLIQADLSGLDTSNVENMYMMFSECSSLKQLDLSNFDTSKVENMGAMFSECHSLTSLNLSGFDTSNVESMSGMFVNCYALTSLNVSSFDTSKVQRFDGMFAWCSNLTSLDVNGFDTSAAETMSYMFYACESLTSLDVNGFDTSNVTDMYRMFSACKSLKSLNLSSFDTSQVTDMSFMFSNCSSLSSLDLSSFDTGNVTAVEDMFALCSSMTSIKIPANFMPAASEDVDLPYNTDYYWTDANGNECTVITTALSGAMTYTRYAVEEETTTAQETTKQSETTTTQSETTKQTAANDDSSDSQTTGIENGTDQDAETTGEYTDLEVPSLTGATNTAQGISVNWNAVSGAESYIICRQVDEGEWTEIGRTISTSYLDASIDSGSICSYTVYAVTEDEGVEVRSEYKTGKTTVRLETPSVVSIECKSAKKLTVNWSSVDGVQGYQVQYSTDESFVEGSITLTIRESSATERTVASLTEGSTYYVRVRAYCVTAAGEKYFSAWTDVQEVMLP